MIDTGVAIAIISGFVTVIGAVFIYVNNRQQRTFEARNEEETRKRESSDKIIELMIDDFKNLREEASHYGDKEQKLWGQIDALRTATQAMGDKLWECERSRQEQGLRLTDLERQVAELKVLIVRWRTHTGLEVPP